ncbi:MAG: HAMP domain-containing histidine kinase [bacterium]|nr:HAMP domain-containing histidine kinase [bacterium]
MNENIQKFISYVLGIIGGATGGTILLSFPSIYLIEHHSFVFLALTSVVGLLVSMFIVEFQKVSLYKQNDKVRDEAITLITHEMRTALTSTGWVIDEIKTRYADTLSEEHKKMLETGTKSVHTSIMHSINLLDISLLNVGKLEISRDWLTLADIKSLISDTLERYSLGAKKKEVSILSDLVIDSDKKIEVDVMRLRIILENLLENALQYTTPGNKVKVTLRNDEESIKLSVSDTGIGIPLSEQGNIFSEFFRATNARKKLSTGSGIGLYLCRKYVKAHEGTITFHSKEKEGTTFDITIPLKTKMDTKEFLMKM